MAMAPQPPVVLLEASPAANTLVVACGSDIAIIDCGNQDAPVKCFFLGDTSNDGSGSAQHSVPGARLISAACFSPDGSRLAVANGLKRLFVYESSCPVAGWRLAASCVALKRIIGLCCPAVATSTACSKEQVVPDVQAETAGPLPPLPPLPPLAHQTIVAADKHGDVYAYELAAEGSESLARSRRLLLGHVSMVTSVVALPGVLVTGDRDEKVRFSAYPKTHLIRGFGLEHTAFVSCLAALPPSESGVPRVASAGGDSFVCVWETIGASKTKSAPALVAKIDLLAAAAQMGVELSAPLSVRALSVCARTGRMAVVIENACAVLVFDRTLKPLCAATTATATAATAALPGAALCAVFALDGSLWVGTTSGLHVFRDFAEPCDSEDRAAASDAEAALPGKATAVRLWCFENREYSLGDLEQLEEMRKPPYIPGAEYRAAAVPSATCDENDDNQTHDPMEKTPKRKCTRNSEKSSESDCDSLFASAEKRHKTDDQ